MERGVITKTIRIITVVSIIVYRKIIHLKSNDQSIIDIDGNSEEKDLHLFCFRYI